MPDKCVTYRRVKGSARKRSAVGNGYNEGLIIIVLQSFELCVRDRSHPSLCVI